MPDSAYTDDEIEAAIAALSKPGRLRQAQEVLARAAPRLHRILDDAISEGGWFDAAHEQAIHEASGGDDSTERERAVRTLIAEETRLGMFVGVAVGFELAQELGYASERGEASAAEDEPKSPTEREPPTAGD